MTLVQTVQLDAAARRRSRNRLLRFGVALVAVLALIVLVFVPSVFFALLMLGGPVLPLLAAYTIVALAGGRKSVVIYLRRFRLTAPTRLLTSGSSVGRQPKA